MSFACGSTPETRHQFATPLAGFKLAEIGLHTPKILDPHAIVSYVGRMLDFKTCENARQKRDPEFDGLFFTAVKWMPIADAISIFFVEPLILTVISGVFLHEDIGWRRISAVCIGFIGALLIIQPSYSIFGAISLLPLATAVLFAIYLALTQVISRTEDPLTMQTFTGLVGCIVLGLTMVFGTTMGIELLTPAWPTSFEWLLLAAVGLIATTVHMMIVHAFKRAPASTLAPFQYLEIVGATALGYFIFGDFPDTLKWIGTFIIVASGLFVLWREQQVYSRKS